MIPPILSRPQDAHLLPTGLSPKRALGFLVAAALVVLFATHERLSRARDRRRLDREADTYLSWLETTPEFDGYEEDVS